MTRSSLATYTGTRYRRSLRAWTFSDSTIPRFLRRLVETNASRAVILIRILVGWVFVSEGTQKFLFPEAVGPGRFQRIRIPSPELMAPFVGTVEILCGSLVLLGFLARLAAVPLLASMAVAVVSTKVLILLGHGVWTFSLPKLQHYGLWSMLHEARTDFSMILGLLLLLVRGAGRMSADAVLLRHG